MIHVVRSRGATPVFVLQVTQLEEDPSIRTLDLKDERAIQAFLENVGRAHSRLMSDQILTTRVYKAQVFIDVVRREGQAAGLRIIDPRPAFAAHNNPASLFIDEIHLTDAGNQLLAQQIASQLAPLIRHGK